MQLGFIGKKHYSGNRKRKKDITTTEKDQTYSLFHAYAIRQMVTFIPKASKVNLDVINGTTWRARLFKEIKEELIFQLVQIFSY